MVNLWHLVVHNRGKKCCWFDVVVFQDFSHQKKGIISFYISSWLGMLPSDTLSLFHMAANSHIAIKNGKKIVIYIYILARRGRPPVHTHTPHPTFSHHFITTSHHIHLSHTYHHKSSQPPITSPITIHHHIKS